MELKVNITQVKKGPPDLSNRLKKELRNIIFNTSGEHIIHKGIIYHYTSSTILPKILYNENESNYTCLRFTDFRFLNDFSEGEELKSFLIQNLRSKLNNKEISQEFYDTITKLSENNVRNDSQLYVACFSEKGDLLPMWNYYLKDGKYQGYSLGFDFNFDEHLRLSPIYKRKVVYNDDVKMKIIEHLILEVISPTYSHCQLIDKCTILLQSIRELALVMKRECFSHENEVRLILDWDMALKEHSQDKKFNIYKDVSTYSTTFDIKRSYGVKEGILTPHCDISWDNKSFLKEIYYAPTMKKSETELGLRLFLEENGYRNVEIHSSKIPVRY